MMNLAEPKVEYAKDKYLKIKDVKALLEWIEKQPHLPNIPEIQAILFLQSCYYSNEQAKITIDNYYTVKALCPDIFGDRNPLHNTVKTAINVMLTYTLPKKTPEGYSVIFNRLTDLDPDHFVTSMTCRALDMSIMLSLHQNGTSKGHIIAMDMQCVTLSHVTKVWPLTMKKFLYYLQNALPVRLKGIHIFNTLPFLDTFLTIVKPFLKKELLEMLHLHTSVDGFVKFVPREILPQDYGGNEPSVANLQEIHNKRMQENADFFKWEESLSIDESKRPGKPKSINEYFGVEGTFKKLEID